MGRLFKILGLFISASLLLNACVKSSGFRTNEMNAMVQIQQTPAEKAKEKPVPQAGSIVRRSGKIQITHMGSPTVNNGNTVVKANLAIEGQSLGEVEFKGVRKDSKILLEPVNPEYNESLKATAYCISDDCDEYFVDVFYKENEVYYHDQFQTASKEEKTEIPAPAGDEQPASPLRPSSKEKQKDPKKETSKKDKETKNKKETILINDEIPFEMPAEPMGFVGTNDDEVKALFVHPKETADEAEKSKVEKQKDKDKAPKPSENQPEPSKGGNTKPPADQGASKPPTPKKPVTPTPPPNSKQQQESPTNKDFPWEVRKDQAVGSSGAGKLRSPTDFFQLSKLPNVFFFVAWPKQNQFWGVLDLAQTLQKMGEFLQTILPGKKLAITEVSKKFGGRLYPHQAHQNGTEADVRYLVRTDESLPSDIVTKGKVTNQFLVADQWKLFKKAFELKQLEVVFVDAAVKRAMCEEAKRVQDLKTRTDQDGSAAEILKRLYPVGGHENHFHVKVKCDHELCRRQPFVVLAKTGC
jgi:penicillin-insensitive murein endopeptidase